MITVEKLNGLIEKAKTSNKLLRDLKLAAYNANLLELAAELRLMETELFPESNESKSAKEKAKKLNLVFRMVDLNISEPVCWLIAETLNAYKSKKGKFSMVDAANLIDRKEKIFNE